MATKTVFLICAYTCVQAITAQCIGSYWAAPFAGPVAAAPFLEYPSYTPCTLAASNGGGFAVNSASPITPTGVYVTSENAYDGAVLVTGQLPFLSAITLEGALPSIGAGIVAYGCGDGNVAILSENIAPASYGLTGPYGYGPIGYGAGPSLYGGPVGSGATGYGCGGLF